MGYQLLFVSLGIRFVIHITPFDKSNMIKASRFIFKFLQLYHREIFCLEPTTLKFNPHNSCTHGYGTHPHNVNIISHE